VGIGFLAKSYDASLQVAVANLRHLPILNWKMVRFWQKNVPATALLELEKRIAELAVLANAVPTL